MVTPEQIETLMNSQGLIYSPRTRRHTKRVYVYAAKRIGSRVKSKYIGTGAYVEAMTEDEMRNKLASINWSD